MKKTAIFLIWLWLFAGCGITPYQPMGLSGGYEDKQIEKDVYLITVKVNSITSEVTAFEYFHRRAAEIVKENGYSRYEVLEVIGTSQKVKSTTTVYDQGERREEPSTIYNPMVYGRIKCYRD